MKFESKLGIGEIVVTKQRGREDAGKIHRDLIGEVVAVVFGKEGPPIYHVRVISDMSIPTVQNFNEYELIGDPLFNQETGEYPTEPEG